MATASSVWGQSIRQRVGIPATLVEKQGRCGGLTRNQKCLDDSHVRLICGQTVTEVRGQTKLEA